MIIKKIIQLWIIIKYAISQVFTIYYVLKSWLMGNRKWIYLVFGWITMFVVNFMQKSTKMWYSITISFLFKKVLPSIITWHDFIYSLIFSTQGSKQVRISDIYIQQSKAKPKKKFLDINWQQAGTWYSCLNLGTK